MLLWVAVCVCVCSVPLFFDSGGSAASLIRAGRGGTPSAACPHVLHCDNVLAALVVLGLVLTGQQGWRASHAHRARQDTEGY